jgi:aminopeptidase
MADAILKKAADLLVDYCLDVREGESVMINSTTTATPLVREVHNGVLQRGAWPLMRISYPGQLEDFYHHARDRQIDEAPRIAREEVSLVDGWLRISAEDNTRGLSEVDPGLQARQGKANGEITRVRLTKKWCGTLYPTAGYAQDAGMSTSDFGDFVWKAMLLDRPDPVAAWRAVHDRQDALVERLSRAKVVRIEAAGTDLTMRVDGRTWLNSSGRRNMPSGEVFTGPIEDSAQGTVRFTIPSRVQGREVAGMELEFRDGRAVRARADRGEDYLLRQLDLDAGARFLGELGIGTNYNIQRSTGIILFDEKIGGTVHLALGFSYPDSGGLNKSSLHWDMILDMRPAAGGGRITLDGEVFSQDGQFLV